MNEIIDYVNRISSLDASSSEDFLSSFESRTFLKDSFIIRANQVCKHYYYIKSGLAKYHYYKDDKEFIMTFFYEEIMFTEFNSYLTGQPSKYMIKALEDTTVYCIDKDKIDALCKKHHRIEALFHKMFAITTLKMIKRISEMLEDNATERYKIFIKDNNKLLQRISLGDVSNYLGITQVSLSRIRANK